MACPKLLFYCAMHINAPSSLRADLSYSYACIGKAQLILDRLSNCFAGLINTMVMLLSVQKVQECYNQGRAVGWRQLELQVAARYMRGKACFGEDSS